MDKKTGYPDDWPLEPDRKFDSEFFTEKELTKKQQENSWLRNRDVEDGVYTEYPTQDYSYSYYECKTVDELTKAFLHGNWAIRQCFTYKNLAFINQINAGDEWWALKKFEDGRLLYFDSITMIRTINSERRVWTEDYNTSKFDEDGERYSFRMIRPKVAEEYALMLTKQLREGEVLDKSKTGRYVVGEAKDPKKDFGIYFIDIMQEYFEDYIKQLLKATYEQCDRLEYTDDEFKEKYRDGFHSIRVKSGQELQERMTK